MTDFGVNISVFLTFSAFQRAIARSLGPNIELSIISSTYRKSFTNPTVLKNGPIDFNFEIGNHKNNYSASIVSHHF